MSRLTIRVARLEGGGDYSSLGEILDALAAEEAGESVDWSVIRVSPVLAAAIDGGLGRGGLGISGRRSFFPRWFSSLYLKETQDGHD